MKKNIKTIVLILLVVLIAMFAYHMIWGLVNPFTSNELP